MSEQDFELYLRLLGKFLRLTPGQEADLADELRDHLEARLEELSRGGMSREDAIRSALDEFGDAARLADHFRQIVRLKRRRLIMRCTLGTVTVSAIALMLATAFWPHDARVPIAGAPAAVGAAEGNAAAPAEGKAKSAVVAPFAESDEDRNLREKLANTPHECEFLEVPLGDVLAHFSEQLKVDVYAPKQQFQEFLEMPITFHIQHTKISARAALELVLKQVELGYVVRDGIIMICHPNELTELRIYDASQLDLPESVHSIRHMGGFGGGEAPKGEPHEPTVPKISGVESLAELIPGIIRPADWIDAGGNFADLRVLGNRLIVRATPEIHREIASLLEQIGKKQVAAAHH
jgi:hypothetical protein